MKIFCIGKNYAKHAAEMGGSVPEVPMVFMKPHAAQLPNGKTFFIPEFSNNIHYEAELVVKINRAGKSIAKEQAWSFIDEVTLGIDFTARDVQAECKAKGHPWEVAKSFDYSAAIGDFVPCSEEQFNDLRFVLKVNQEIRQEGNPNHMIFDIPTIIAFISKRFTVQPGDLIFTGTPEGVGQVHPGDLLELFLDDKKVLITDIK